MNQAVAISLYAYGTSEGACKGAHTKGQKIGAGCGGSVEDARKFVERLHRGQTDKAGLPYINHLTRVAAAMNTDVERTVALLHDVVEDTETTLEDVRARFGPEVAQAVDALSRRSTETYRQYIGRVKDAGGVALRVKLADLRDNYSRPAPKSMEGMKKRYEWALQELGG